MQHRGHQSQAGLHIYTRVSCILSTALEIDSRKYWQELDLSYKLRLALKEVSQRVQQQTHHSPHWNRTRAIESTTWSKVQGSAKPFVWPQFIKKLCCAGNLESQRVNWLRCGESVFKSVNPHLSDRFECAVGRALMLSRIRTRQRN